MTLLSLSFSTASAGRPASSAWPTLTAIVFAALSALMPAASVAEDAAIAGEYDNKVAVITGSSHGLGHELAMLGASKGMKLVLVDIRPEGSKTLAKQIREDGGQAIVFEADLASAEQRPGVIAAAMDEYGRIDYLFNNAGYSYLATHEQMDLEQARQLFEVNYWAYADLAQRVIPIMRDQGGGTIVNVSSILGMRAAPPALGHYAATKHALHGLFQTSAQELKKDNIKVFLAAPGGMKTLISQHSVGPMADPKSDRAASWEDPAIVAKDIFAAMQGDEVIFNPGYEGRQ